MSEDDFDFEKASEDTPSVQQVALEMVAQGNASYYAALRKGGLSFWESAAIVACVVCLPHVPNKNMKREEQQDDDDN